MTKSKIEIYVPQNRTEQGLMYVFNYKDMSCGIFTAIGLIQLVIYERYYSGFDLGKIHWNRTYDIRELRHLKCFLRDVNNVENYRKNGI